MKKSEAIVVGIDLGTTNSEIAAWTGEKVEVLGPAGTKVLPSCVGVTPAGEVLVGEAARNQYLLRPEDTARSVKRKMGTDEVFTLGGKRFTPQEVSALILRTLADWAERQLEAPVGQAVITVPAYFSDAARQATREAGELAGLEVLRILNEPTAASLAYGYGSSQGAGTVLVYDLGGGTFDVSVVRLEGNVTEVLASHGDNRLGGDDFDLVLLDHMAREVERSNGVDPRGDRAVRARLLAAAEAAKIELSAAPYARVREENLLSVSGKPVHLELEIAREKYEDMVRPLLESTLESVSRALADADVKPAELDGVILVGGSTRTPLVSRLLERHVGHAGRHEIHPDLCVALGAGVLATRLGGGEVERVLVDVSPYSFGPKHLGRLNGAPYPHCYRPIIRRNTPLPVTRTESYFTAAPFQTSVHFEIFQGEEPDALRNVPVGDFLIEGLAATVEPNEVLCRMSLDLDGLLQVTAVEKATGKSKQITITQAFEKKSAAEMDAARRRLGQLPVVRADAGSFTASGPVSLPSQGDAGVEERLWEQASRQARRLQQRSRDLLSKMHEDDQEEAAQLSESIESALASHDLRGVSEAAADLDELLFFVEGR